MKILTKEEEAAHYNATLQGGTLGGLTGLGVGALGVFAASKRYHFFRSLTLPLKAFLVTSSGTFAGIVAADHSSRKYEQERNPIDVEYKERSREIAEQAKAGKTFTQRAMDFGREERYKIVAGSWIASMFIAFGLVNRNKYLTGQQKLVQARVYAQFLTVGVLVATAAFEISDRRNEEGRYEKYEIFDPKDPEHKRKIEKMRPVESDSGDTMWKDMIAAEEQRMKERDEEEKRLVKEHEKKHNAKSSSKSKKDDGKSSNKKETGDKEDSSSEEKSKKSDEDKKDKSKSSNKKEDSSKETSSSEEKSKKSDDDKKDDKVASANDAKNKK